MIYKMQKIHAKFVFAAADTGSKTYSVQTNGWAKQARIEVSTITSNATVDVTVLDAEGYQVFDGGTLTAGSKTVYPGNDLTDGKDEVRNVPFGENYVINCAISQAPGAGGATIDVMFYLSV